jgi:hypothetical protein
VSQSGAPLGVVLVVLYNLGVVLVCVHAPYIFESVQLAERTHTVRPVCGSHRVDTFHSAGVVIRPIHIHFFLILFAK